jgi:hypothetical protein
MTYRLDGSGQVSASLDVKVASPVARSFGRTSVETIEHAGGALTGAEITGTDAASEVATAQQDKAAARDDLAETDRQLAQVNLPAQVRQDLLASRSKLIADRRSGAQAEIDAETRVALTPISFAYHAGSGVGLSARLSEAAQVGYASVTWTLGAVLMLLAYLGPPMILLLLLALLWQRLGRRVWNRAFPRIPLD